LRFGIPDHFTKVLLRLRFGAKVKVKISEGGLEADSTIGVRQGSCEGPVLFHLYRAGGDESASVALRRGEA
jgi:hypothetical protein